MHNNKINILNFIIGFLLIFSFESSAQYDTAKLNLNRGNYPNNGQITAVYNPPNANQKKDGFAFVASAGVFYTFNDAIKDSFGQKAIFMPTFAIYFGKTVSPFIEMSFAKQMKFRSNTNHNIANLYFFTAGVCNQVILNDRLSFRQKYGLTLLNTHAEYMDLDTKLKLGFLAALGIQTHVNDNFLLYFDANYMYQKNNFGGIRLEPGVILQF